MSYDLAVYTEKPGSVPTREYVRSLHERLRNALEASGGWFELTTHDLQGSKAKWFLENDGLFDPKLKSKFEDFCRREQISGEPLTEETALRFMVQDAGAHLATVVLPSDPQSCATVFQTMIGFARRHGLRIVDPQAGQEVDLEHPGERPPLWK